MTFKTNGHGTVLKKRYLLLDETRLFFSPIADCDPLAHVGLWVAESICGTIVIFFTESFFLSRTRFLWKKTRMCRPCRSFHLGILNHSIPHTQVPLPGKYCRCKTSNLGILNHRSIRHNLVLNLRPGKCCQYR